MRRSWVLFAAMCVIWGVPYLLIRVAVRDIPPGTLVFARTGIGGLVLLPFAIRAGGFRPVLRRWRPLIAFSAIEVAGPWFLLSDAERHLSSSLTGLLVAATPLVGVLVVRLTGGSDRGVGPARGAGLVLGVVGVALLLGLDLGAVQAGPVLEVGLVAIGYASAPVILSRTLADLPSIPVIAASLLLTALGYLPYAVTHPPVALRAESVSAVLALALVCTALAFVVFFALIAEIGPARATVITYVNPAVAIVLGVTVLGERFTAGMAIGFPLVLLGSFLAARPARHVPAVHDAVSDAFPGARSDAGSDTACEPVPEAAVAMSVEADLAVRRVEDRGDDAPLAVRTVQPFDVDAVQRLGGRRPQMSVDSGLVADDLEGTECHC